MTLKKKILLVDDEPDILELIGHSLLTMGYECIFASSLTQALKQLYKHDYFLCLTDMRLPDGDGIELVKHIQVNKPFLPVAMLTAYGNIEGAVSTLKAGAFDYVSKPIQIQLLKKLVETALKMDSDSAASSSSSSSFNVDENKHRLVGESEQISTLKSDIKKVSRSQAPVFIYGESGVGKELVARLIHNNSPQNSGLFVPVNCGAIASELMESEFFGHKKGSFTGAVTDHQGLFQSAQGGTLFLDEIAELPLHMQVKLLRAIQEKSIRPVGETSEVAIDVRILSASHKNLMDEISNNNFRKDLYYRINVIELSVPSLRAHKSDIPILVDFLLNKLIGPQGRAQISKEAIMALENYSFPGNVRELENILERALALCENNYIQTSDLQLPIYMPSQPEEASDHNDNKLAQSMDTYLDGKQREVIIDALEKTKWNRTAAAKLLGISFRALRYRLKKLGIE